MPTPRITPQKPVIRPRQTDKNISFETIPGLPYTREECIAAALKGLEDCRAGRTVSQEDLEKEILTWK
jgi:predicted transcriptional regulator